MATKSAKDQAMHLCRFLLLISIFFSASTCFAASIYSVPRSDGEHVRVSIDIDKVTKLAGLKVSISYDQNALQFMEASKTKATTSLMHVVNDNTPGRLIIVMAGAKGISGENLSIMDLEFRPVSDPGRASGIIKIEEIQLMDENLHDIQATILQQPAPGTTSTDQK